MQFILEDLENLLDDVHDLARLWFYQVCPVIDYDIAIFHVWNLHGVELNLQE